MKQFATIMLAAAALMGVAAATTMTTSGIAFASPGAPSGQAR